MQQQKKQRRKKIAKKEDDGIDGWSELHQPLLELIFKHLSLPDRLSFGSVCRCWRAVKKESVSPPPPQLPWIILQKPRLDKTLRFYSPSERRMYEIPTHPSFDLKHRQRCSGGWLLLDEPFYFTQPGCLVNPISKRCLVNPISKKIIHLPMTENPSNQFFISSSSKAANSMYLVRLRNYRILWIFRPGRDCEWMKEKSLNKTIFYATISGEEGKLYCLNYRNWLVVIELDTGNEKVFELRLVRQPNYRSQNLGLVESCREVFLVMMTKREGNYDEFISHNRYWFDVFKADMEARAWVKVDSLGDRVLFVSHINGIICVPTAETGGKANHIYYIPEENTRYWIEFDLGEGIAEAHSIPGSGIYVTESWIIPSLQ